MQWSNAVSVTPWPLEGLVVLSTSLLAVLIITHVCFTYSDALIKRVGTSGSLVLNRLMAFLVFCVGIQMFVGGFSGSFPKLAG